jgi:hypothetical protein
MYWLHTRVNRCTLGSCFCSTWNVLILFLLLRIYVNSTCSSYGLFLCPSSTHTVDEHRDMRLDINSVTYEVFGCRCSVNSHHMLAIVWNSSLFFLLQDPLALEEQIGDVNTGLTKSHIVDKLRTSLYVPGIASMSDQPSKSSLDDDARIICQVILLRCMLCLLTTNFQLFQTMNHHPATCPRFDINVAAAALV